MVFPQKYLELRTKLDWAREMGAKKIRKAEQKAKELRAKFAFAGNVTLLDSVQLPGIRDRTPASSVVSGYDSGFEEPSTWSGKGGKRSNHSKMTTYSNRSSAEVSDDGYVCMYVCILYNVTLNVLLFCCIIVL